MLFSHWLTHRRYTPARRLGPPSRTASTRNTRSPHRTFKPRLEQLEERLTPTTFNVTPGGAGLNSLQGAVTQANTDTGSDVIVLASGQGKYNLTQQISIYNPNSGFSLTIEGSTSSAGDTVIDAGGNSRVFLIEFSSGVAPSVTFQNLTIQGGKASDSGSGASGTPAEGGGILDHGGNLTLNNVVLQNNEAMAGAGQAAQGGGVYMSGPSLTITNSVIQHNSAKGGYDGSAASNGGAGSGGGVFANGALTISASTLSDNHADGGDGGTGGTDDDGGSASGGGVFANGALTISASTLSENNASGGNGGTGSAHDDGGSASGGGVFANGALAINASTISDNAAYGGGGRNFALKDYGGSASGGGILAKTGATINASTLSHNVASGGTFVSNGNGGAALGGGALLAGGTLTNATIADNAAVATASGASPPSPVASGGGVYVSSPSPMTFTNVTVAYNSAQATRGASVGTSGGGIGQDTTPKPNFSLVNSLVALNSAATGPDFQGALASGDHNLIGNADGSSGLRGVNGNLTGTTASLLDPKLGALAYNGGPTQTIALLTGSPAINAGDNNALSISGPNDQRGLPRSNGGSIDIGAVQVSQPPPPQANSSSSSASNPSPPNAGIIGLAIEEFELTIDMILSDIEGMVGMSHAALDATIAQMQTAIQTDVSFSTSLGQEAVSLGQSLAFSSLSHS